MFSGKSCSLVFWVRSLGTHSSKVEGVCGNHKEKVVKYADVSYYYYHEVKGKRVNIFQLHRHKLCLAEGYMVM